MDCARKSRPAATTRARDWSSRQPTLVTYVLIAMNVAVFVWMGAANSANFRGSRITEQIFNLALFRGPMRSPWSFELAGTADGEWYRLFSSAFIHFGFMHIAFNMLLLLQLGIVLERAIGRSRFALIFVASLLGGSAGVLLLSPNSITGGASGGVFGLLGAAAVMQYRAGVNPLSTGIGTTIILNVVITMTLPNISIGGHVGGLVAGAAAGWFGAALPRFKVPKALQYGGPVAVALIALVVCFVAGSA